MKLSLAGLALGLAHSVVSGFGPRCRHRGLGAARRGAPISLLAKKGGKGKGKKGAGGPKGGGLAEWSKTLVIKPVDSTALRLVAETVCSSYSSSTGQPLHATLKGGADLPKALWAAPVALLVVSDKAPDDAADDAAEAGPEAAGLTLVYANLAGLELLGAANGDKEHQNFIGKSVRGLALPAQLPADKKFESGYSKKLRRIQASSSGAGGAASEEEGGEEVLVQGADRWIVERAVIQDGQLAVEGRGVAYAATSWVLGGGPETPGAVVCTPGGGRAVVEGGRSLEELEEAVALQGAKVRSLKESGLSKGQGELDDAVAELLRLKSLVSQ